MPTTVIRNGVITAPPPHSGQPDKHSDENTSGYKGRDKLAWKEKPGKSVQVDSTG